LGNDKSITGTICTITGSGPRNKILGLKHEVVIGTSMLKSVRQDKLIVLREPEDNIIK
jgi:hypothetical protein